MLNDISLKEALNLSLENTISINTIIYKNIEEANGYILAEDIKAKKNSPSFSNSAMDGFAFKYSNNKKLKIIKTIYAGDKFDNFNIKENECVKIMTGAKVPQGLDTVIPIEKCKIEDNYILFDKIKKGANVRIKGEEIKKGDILLEKGDEITPQNIALLASQGIYMIKVYKKPSIAIISTGNELKEPWENSDEDEIHNANSYALKSLLNSYGYNAEIFGIIPDNLEKTINFINNLKKYDVIISTGGISFGDADFMYKAFKANGLKELFHGIALKPGRPTMAGIMDDSFVFAMPGNPISAYLNTFILAIPTLRKISNAKNYYFNFIYAKNKSEFTLNPKKDHIILGKLHQGEWETFNNYKYGSYMLSILSKSNSVVVSEKKEKISEDFLKIIPFKTDFIDKNLFFN